MNKLKFSVISVLIFFSAPLAAQMIYTEIGRSITKLDYKNSSGESLENMYPGTNFVYEAGYRHTLSRAFYLTGSLTFSHYSSTASDSKYNNNFSWDARFIGIGVGLEFDFYRINKFSFQAKLGLEPQFFVYGNQSVNGQINDLKKQEEFDKPYLFTKGGLGIIYCADDLLAVTLRYTYGRGFPLGNNENAEKLNLISNSLSVGLIVSFRTCDYCFTKHFD